MAGIGLLFTLFFAAVAVIMVAALVGAWLWNEREHTWAKITFNIIVVVIYLILRDIFG